MLEERNLVSGKLNNKDDAYLGHLTLQKSRVKWLREDDGNSHYFHVRKNMRRKHNHIAPLWIDNFWVEQVA